MTVPAIRPIAGESFVQRSNVKALRRIDDLTTQTRLRFRTSMAKARE
jgi:hypothetical protein